MTEAGHLEADQSERSSVPSLHQTKNMESIDLFKTGTNEWLTTDSLLNSLYDMGAHDCNVLFIHSALNFGAPNPKLKPKILLGHIMDVIRQLHVPTICMPTFTFSSCNGKIYDPLTSKSRMGALNEFFRGQPGVSRSMDPLMSVALEGQDTDLITGISTHSIGEESTYDRIHYRDGVKFLFLGPRIGDCFTYMHYLEWLFSVDYRYIRHFKGLTRTADNALIETDNDLFVRYKGITPSLKGTYFYGDYMCSTGSASSKMIGGGHIEIVEEKGACRDYLECHRKNPYFLVDASTPFREKTFLLESEMVAL